MDGWTYVSPERRCPVCGADACCEFGPDGLVWCSLRAAFPVPGYTHLVDGAYVADGASPSLRALESDRVQARQEATARVRVHRDLQEAARIVRRSRLNHPLIEAYIGHLGVPIGRLPGRVAPACLRLLERAERWVRDGDGWSKADLAPALVVVYSRPDRQLAGVQLIALDQDGRADAVQDQRRWGGCETGASAHLGEAFEEARLFYALGVEDGLAIAAATGGSVWACSSPRGLRAAALPQSGALRAGVREIVYAAPRGAGFAELLDRARILAEQHRRVRFYTVAPAMFDAWAETYREHGPVLTLDQLSRAAPVVVLDDGEEAPVEPERAVLPDTVDARGRLALLDLYGPPERTPQRGLRLRRWDGVYWRHTGTHYKMLSEDGLHKHVAGWLAAHMVRKRWDVVPADPVRKAVTEVMTAMGSGCYVEADEMPVWLPPDFDERGEPLFEHRAPYETCLQPGQWAHEGLPDPRELIVFQNGLLDVQAWIHGEVRLLPHTERLFTATALPYDCPVEQLMSAGEDEGAVQELLGRYCPKWMEFLYLVSGEDDAGDREAAEEAKEWQQALAMAFGYSLVPWTRHEVIFVLSGPPRAGKGTVLEALQRLVGPENVASPDLNLITDKFVPQHLTGKAICVFSDADVGRTTDAVRATEMLKRISGGDTVYADRKYKDAMPSLRLRCKIWVMCNRMPTLPDPSGALAARFRVFQLERSFVGEVRPEFKDPATMDREATGRMIWALHGLRMLAKAGAFPQPRRGRQLLQEYMDYSDPLRTFVTEVLAEDRQSFVSSAELYAVWKAYCSEVGKDTPHTLQWFVMQLRATCPWIREGQPRQDGKRPRGYYGLRIVNDPRVVRAPDDDHLPMP